MSGTDDGATTSRNQLTSGDVFGLVGGLVAVGAALVGVLYLLGLFVTSDAASSLRSSFDLPLLRFFEDARSETLTSLMRAITFVGGTPMIMLLLLGGALLSYVLERTTRWSIFFVSVLALAPQSSALLKELVGRPRPTLSPLYEIASDAFPSGHATNSAAALGAVAMFVALRSKTPWIVWGLAGVVVLAVGVTRVYLGVHWPTDVIAGWLLGAAWVGACALLIRPAQERGEGRVKAGILRT